MKLEWRGSWPGAWRQRVRGATLPSLVAGSLLACGAAPQAQPLSPEAAIPPKAGVGDGAAAPVSAPAGVIALGRARDYRQWVELEQASPVIGYLKKQLVEQEGDALLEDWDLTQSVEFIATF